MNLNGASILVTGGSGSFGQAFVQRLITKHNPRRLVVFSRGEHAQELMAHKFKHPALRFFIGDVRDQGRLELALRDIQIVIHAAALKIVPTAEYNPTEAVATNIGGAVNVVGAALRTGVKKVIALSTDKACNPINLYGSTKLAAEKIFMAANNLSGRDGCGFGVVRYGNVFGSQGSVVPFFRSLIAQGKELSITDERMTRFNITMDQAIDLVLRAIKLPSHGRIYVPKIPSFKVMDLAEAMNPGGKRLIVGIRPGEKLHETLLTEDEGRFSVNWGKDHFHIMPLGSPSPFEVIPRYTSDTNSDWLTVEQLRAMV